jgi:Domain of unknown function (DUF1937)
VDDGRPGGGDLWRRLDRHYLACCDEVVVLMLDGGQESAGVQAEIALAPKLGKPVRNLAG